ncbi:hypothetical protein F2Q69_00047277 [Brassica cretica]|uniref:Uncharacterized protein n=1 Tax=Brassica cretica TaxID=69181 RepID=A0A8S9PL37_BRACR|nr:hypothetical protein F2Q69_00047277 [Brassica cretica]
MENPLVTPYRFPTEAPKIGFPWKPRRNSSRIPYGNPPKNCPSVFRGEFLRDSPQNRPKSVIHRQSIGNSVLECHMEFLGLFGCIWSSKEVKYVIIGRAEQGSEVPQRRHEVTPKHLSERPSWSDPVKLFAIFTP